MMLQTKAYVGRRHCSFRDRRELWLAGPRVSALTLEDCLWRTFIGGGKGDEPL